MIVIGFLSLSLSMEGEGDFGKASKRTCTRIACAFRSFLPISSSLFRPL